MGKKLVECWLRKRYCYADLDIMMPKKDGFHVLKRFVNKETFSYHFISKDNR